MSEQRERIDPESRFAERRRRLHEARSGRITTAIADRFTEIDGGTAGTLVSVELFTTVIPLIILGFGYFSGFASNASPGTVFIRETGLHHPLDDQVREAFGNSAGLRSSWTIFGVAGFLVWGIPMSITIAAIFGKAWRREQFGIGQRLLRGAIWFLLYLVMLATREWLTYTVGAGTTTHALMFVVGLIPVWIFWSLTPPLLVRDGGRGLRYLLLAGLAGVAVDGVVLPLASRVAFPALLSGWNGFGPIGVAMTLILWCGVIGVGWVVIACVGAVFWERITPEHTVLESQTA